MYKMAHDDTIPLNKFAKAKKYKKKTCKFKLR